MKKTIGIKTRIYLMTDSEGFNLNVGPDEMDQPKWRSFSCDIGWKPWRWFLWKMRSRIQYLFTGNCGNMCEDNKSYDCFVPEAGCPIHDVEEK